MANAFYREGRSAPILKGGTLSDSRERLQGIARHVRNGCKHARVKLAKQEKEREETRKAKWYTHVADTLLADPSPYPKGTNECMLKDIYTGEDTVVRLNPKFDAIGNAQLLYKKARKARRGTEVAGRKVTDTQRETEMLESLLKRVDSLLGRAEEVSEPEVAALEDEVVRIGLKKQEGGRPRTEVRESDIPFRHYVIDGSDVYIGKNDEQNDELSVHFTKPWDIWMHVVAHPGSHVVIRRDKNKGWPSEKILQKAASLAVWFSQARHTKQSEVHVTEGRYVRKRRKAPPGEVIAERCKTIRVAPRSPQELFSTDQRYSATTT